MEINSATSITLKCRLKMVAYFSLPSTDVEYRLKMHVICTRDLNPRGSICVMVGDSGFPPVSEPNVPGFIVEPGTARMIPHAGVNWG
ncbi:hypothetical protein RRG08_022510 [Elysia crispata]|uniref:Uncharacterized protein n=1 Tax=Elysia crispata TaxID=231223 RepID=A0AAE0Z2K1_9GAST|nr:hypothetical protein RRG08_022510 [Elysia crispata]